MLIFRILSVEKFTYTESQCVYTENFSFYTETQYKKYFFQCVILKSH